MPTTSAALPVGGGDYSGLTGLLSSLLGQSGSSLLGGAASLGGSYLAGQNQQNAYNGLQSALGTIGPTQLGGFNFSGPGGMSSSFNPSTGTGGIDLGSLNGAFGNLSGAATAGAGAYSPGVLSQLLSGASGTMPQAQGNLNSAYAGNNAFQSLAQQQAQSAGQTYNSVYGNTLSGLQAIQQPQVQQQAFGLQNTLFGNGTLNSSGAASGALAAGNFGSQVNAMNAQDQLSAQQQALAAQSAQTQNAATLSGTGTNMLNGAFSNFGNTSSLMSSLNSAQLNNSLSALQGAAGLNTLGLNNYQQGLGTSAQAASAKNNSLLPYAMTAQALAGTQNGQSLLANGLTGLGSSLLGSNGGGLAQLLSGSGGSSIVNALKGLLGGGSSNGSSGGNVDLSNLFGGTGLTGSNPGTINPNYSFNSGGYDPTTGTFNDTGTSTDSFGMGAGSFNSGSQTDTSGLWNNNNFLGDSSGDGGLSSALAQYGFNGAGGQAATSSPSLTSGPTAQAQSPLSNLSSNLGTAGSVLGIAQGLTSGRPTGQAGAALSTAGLANKYGAFGGTPNASLSQGLGAAGGALGLYSGLQQGGVSGYAGAASGALRAGSGIAGLAGNSALSSGLGAAAGVIAAPLALYNFAKSYQSGDTAGDTIRGAETGATIGSVIPVVGTLLGGVIGGAVGAISSAFGGGKNDPETLAVNGLNAQVAAGKVDPTQALQTPQSAFTYLAGVMDAKNATAGHSEPIEQVFGRMGESNLTNSMFTQINSAISAGTIKPNASASQIFSSVVQPWLTSKGAGIDPNSVDLKGNNTGNQLVTSLQSLISNWQSGSLTSATAIGSKGQADALMPVFAGIGASQPSTSTVTNKAPSPVMGGYLYAH